MLVNDARAAGKRAFEETAARRVDRLGEALTRLVDSGDQNAADEVHREVHTLKSEASLLELADLALVCSKLEDILFFAHRRRYDVPIEVLLTASMAVELIAYLVQTNESKKVDVGTFVAQVDEVLKDTGATAPRRDLVPRPPSSNQLQAVASRVPKTRPTVDRLGRSARERLANVACGIYVESLRADEDTAPRLRTLYRELEVELRHQGQIGLRDHLAPHCAGLDAAAREAGKLVAVATDVADTQVSPEVAWALETATVHLLTNAVAHGIESPTDRERLGKSRTGLVRLQVQLRDGAAILVVEDDGGGIDVDAVTREAKKLGLVATDASSSESSAQSLVFERGLTTATGATPGAGRGVGLDAVRNAVKAVNGAIHTKTASGRGMSVRVTIADADMTREVRTFRTQRSDVLFAVDASWSTKEDDAGAAIDMDPLDALGLLRGEWTMTGLRPLVFRRGTSAFRIQAHGRALPAVASRVAPVAHDAPIEIVRVGDTEAVLLRLDRLPVVHKGGVFQTEHPSSGAAGRSGRHRKFVETGSDAPMPEKVLLLEDSATWLVMTRSALLQRGFDVCAVGTVQAFLNALTRWGPDVVLADVNLPEVPGDELCRRIKETRPLLPVILISDGNPEELVRKANVARADAALSKSLGPDRLADEIRKHARGVSA